MKIPLSLFTFSCYEFTDCFEFPICANLTRHLGRFKPMSMYHCDLISDIIGLSDNLGSCL